MPPIKALRDMNKGCRESCRVLNRHNHSGIYIDEYTYRSAPSIEASWARFKALVVVPKRLTGDVL